MEDCGLTLVLVIYRDGLPVCRQSPIQVVTTWLRPDRESNPQSFDRKSSIVTVTPPSHLTWVTTSWGTMWGSVRRMLESGHPGKRHLFPPNWSGKPSSVRRTNRLCGCLLNAAFGDTITVHRHQQLHSAHRSWLIVKPRRRGQHRCDLVIVNSWCDTVCDKC